MGKKSKIYATTNDVILSLGWELDSSNINHFNTEGDIITEKPVFLYTIDKYILYYFFESGIIDNNSRGDVFVIEWLGDSNKKETLFCGRINNVSFQLDILMQMIISR